MPENSFHHQMSFFIFYIPFYELANQKLFLAYGDCEQDLSLCYLSEIRIYRAQYT